MLKGETAVRNCSGIKSAKKKRCIGKTKMHPLKDKQGKVISNFNNIANAAEDCCSELHSSQINDITLLCEFKAEQDIKVPCVTINEVTEAI